MYILKNVAKIFDSCWIQFVGKILRLRLVLIDLAESDDQSTIVSECFGLVISKHINIAFVTENLEQILCAKHTHHGTQL